MYAVWRFFAEYLRNDDRGATVVSFLSPSQLMSILLCLVGAAILLYPVIARKWREKHEA
jgi:prolipoprotein diacylglyceryltransferase